MTSQRPHTTNKRAPYATEWNPPRKFSAYATASRTLYATARILEDIGAQPHFVVVNCSDGEMTVFYSPVFTRSLSFCSCELLCCSVDFIFLRYPNLDRWYSSYSVQWHKIRIVDIEEYVYYVNKLRQNVVWKHEYDVKCDDTNSTHQIQMTTICLWMITPHENFLRTPLRSITLKTFGAHKILGWLRHCLVIYIL